jgi:molecular chaperone DnaJ
MPDYYKILGIAKTSTPDEIKDAYRDLALRFHPDRNPSNRRTDARFHLISRAYEVLHEPKKRKFYDRTGMSREELMRPGQTGERLEKWMTDILDEVLRRKKRKPVRGKDYRYTLELTFVEAAFGVEKTILVPAKEACVDCKGTGSKGDAPLVQCHVCDGEGETRSGQGVVGFRETCMFCEGEGTVITQACEPCEGTGEKHLEKEFQIPVPPAAMDGQRLRYRGAGESGDYGGTDGDLFVVLKLLPESFFVREGYDVRVVLPLTVKEAVLGAKIAVPTLDGPVWMRVPGGAFSGQRLRIQARGIPHRRGKDRGDLYVELKVEMPCGATEELQALLKQWPEPNGNAHPKRQYFDEEMKRRYDGEIGEEA